MKNFSFFLFFFTLTFGVFFHALALEELGKPVLKSPLGQINTAVPVFEWEYPADSVRAFKLFLYDSANQSLLSGYYVSPRRFDLATYNLENPPGITLKNGTYTWAVQVCPARESSDADCVGSGLYGFTVSASQQDAQPKPQPQPQPSKVLTGVCAPCDAHSDCGAADLKCNGDKKFADGKKEGYCQYASSDKVALCNPLRAGSFTELLDKIINFIFNVAIVLSPILVVYAGFLFLTSAGKPQQVVTARNVLLWTAIGFIVILLSKGLVKVLQGIIGF